MLLLCERRRDQSRAVLTDSWCHACQPASEREPLLARHLLYRAVRRPHAPVPCCISCWLSGGTLHHSAPAAKMPTHAIWPAAHLIAPIWPICRQYAAAAGPRGVVSDAVGCNDLKIEPAPIVLKAAPS
jgi:hypothetical protein